MVSSVLLFWKLDSGAIEVFHWMNREVYVMDIPIQGVYCVYTLSIGNLY